MTGEVLLARALGLLVILLIICALLITYCCYKWNKDEKRYIRELKEIAKQNAGHADVASKN